jgi:hypothetical protein
MKIKLALLSCLLAALIIASCDIQINLANPTAQPSAQQTEALVQTAEPPAQATEPPAPPAIQANVTCNEVSLYLDPALGSDYECLTVSESSGQDMPPMGVYPQYTEIKIKGYPLTGKFFEPHIDVYPVQRYSELLPDIVPSRVNDLQALIGAGGYTSGGELPLLPVFNAQQMFNSQVILVYFQNGQGIRYLTEYAQYFAPINNTDMFYTFQGLTSDGQYWISAVLPINNGILPPDATNPPSGQTWDQFSNNYGAYIADTINQLNGQSPNSFTPTITLLDALIGSISIQP